jgi:hypothetical protein
MMLLAPDTNRLAATGTLTLYFLTASGWRCLLDEEQLLAAVSRRSVFASRVFNSYTPLVRSHAVMVTDTNGEPPGDKKKSTLAYPIKQRIWSDGQSPNSKPTVLELVVAAVSRGAERGCNGQCVPACARVDYQFAPCD